MYQQYKERFQNEKDNLETQSLSNLNVASENAVTEESGQENAGKVNPSDEIKAMKSHVNNSSHLDVLDVVEKCWEQIDTECEEYGKQPKYQGVDHKTGWKTVRVFVSSTFTDFFCEREILVKKVFPELREWCHLRQIYLIECDMRWGVPKDSQTSETVLACLEELDRCLMETSGKPFFLNLLGERYGWIPFLSEVSEEIQRKYSWVPNTSITFMEVLHGAYRMRNPNAFFMLRDASIMKDIPKDQVLRFMDNDSLCKQHLKHLKTRLKSRFPDQVHEYSCRVNGTVNKHCREIVNIEGLEQFSQQILDFFKKAIDSTYPHREVNPQLSESLVLIEDDMQTRTVEETAFSSIGRKKEADLIIGYLKGQHGGFKIGDGGTPFSRDSMYWTGLTDGHNKPMCLFGQPGFGKTTLLASVVKESLKLQDTRTFYHFCGSTGNSSDVTLLLQRLITFLTNDHSAGSLTRLHHSADYVTLRDKLREELLALCTMKDHQKIIIIIDSLDQLNSHRSVEHLSWLPPSFPAGVQCIVSSNLHPPTVSRLQEHPHLSYTLGTLSQEDAQLIVEQFLKNFNKRLDTEQLKMILDSKCSENPLWLYLVCEELRVFGDFRTLNRHVKSVTTSVEEMVKAIVQRVIEEDESGLIEKTILLVACSHGIVTALDVQRMLGDIPTREPLPTLQWVKVRRTLKILLNVTNHRDEVQFAHNEIKRVICDTLIKTKEATIKWNTILADYFETWSEDQNKKRDDLPFYLIQAGLKIRLVNYLRNVPESARIPFFRRSEYMRDHCRCRQLADPVIPNVKPAVICIFCQDKKAVFHPTPFHFNKSMCFVCGNQIFSASDKNVAYLCPFHVVYPMKCFLCKRVTDQKSCVLGKLCDNCGFGNLRKQCVALSHEFVKG